MLPLTRALLASALLLLVTAGACAEAVSEASGDSSRVEVILVRHAEAGHEGRDPELRPAGLERAACLVTALEDRRVTHLFASPLRRTQQTLAPIASQRGLEPAVREPLPVEALVAELSSLPAGSVAVVAGHSNTLPPLARALGAELTGLVDEGGQPALPREEHDRLIVLTLRRGSEIASGERLVSMDERRYGCPQPAR